MLRKNSSRRDLAPSVLTKATNYHRVINAKFVQSSAPGKVIELTVKRQFIYFNYRACLKFGLLA